MGLEVACDRGMSRFKRRCSLSLRAHTLGVLRGMTWTRISDNWTERADLGHLTHADRWHYLALIVLCSRSGAFDGNLRLVDARRASDHEDPVGVLRRLSASGLIEMTSSGIRLIEIDDHVPPPSVRNKSELGKYRMRRSRAHRAGDHSLCLPKYCEDASPVSSDVMRDVTRDVTRNPGTGRDGTGQDYNEAEKPLNAPKNDEVLVPVLETSVDAQGRTVKTLKEVA